MKNFSFVHPGHNFAFCVLSRVHRYAPRLFQQKVLKHYQEDLEDFLIEGKRKGHRLGEDCDLWKGVDKIFRANVEKTASFLKFSPLEKDFLALGIIYSTYSNFSFILDVLCTELSIAQVVRLFGIIFPYASTDEIERVLTNESLLSRTGLIIFSFPFEIEMSNELANEFLREEFDYTACLGKSFESAPPPRLTSKDFSYLEEYEILRAYLETAVEERVPGTHLLLYGPVGSGKTELVRLLGREIGAEVFEPRYRSEKYQEMERFLSYRIADYSLKEQRAFILFDDADSFLSRYAEKGWFNRVLERAQVPTVWICNRTEEIEPALLRRFDLVVRMDYLPEEARRRMLRYYLGDLLGSEEETERWLDQAAQRVIPPSVAAQTRKVLSRIKGKCRTSPSRAATLVMNHILEILGFESI